MSKSKFYDKIKYAKEEREIEDVYVEGLNLYFCKNNIQITHPYKCDGLIDKDLFLKLLIEYKYDEDLHNTVSRAKVLIQVVYYLKQFELNGDRLPNVIMVGDINEVFVMHTNPLLKYLDEKVDWTIAPSCAYEKCPELIIKISKDNEISPYVYDINENFSFKDVADKINEIAVNNIRKVRVTEHNISKIFDDFIKRVLKNSEKISPNDLVGIFISSIIDRDNCYQHPNNENKLVCHNNHYDINGKYYKTFFSHFEKEYSPEDKNKFTEISDRLIEDTKRRRSGEFYTKTIFADYAHKMLSEELGEDWKEKYIVWDCCWGTGNLTRDYRFKELYASTIEKAELDCGKRYNLESTKFVFDFLNDDINNLFGCKLPLKLYEAFEQNKPIIFFINPPYGTASNAGAKGTSKKNCAKTRINKKMLNDRIGNCSQNLYAQFIYRICLIKEHFKLTNIHIGLYSPTLFLSGSSFKELRKVLFKNFDFKQAIQFKASHFSDVAEQWGISFSIWSNGTNKQCNEFIYNLIDVNEENEIYSLGQKTIYNLDNKAKASDWAKSDNNYTKDTDCICFKSAIRTTDKIKKISTKTLSYLANDQNNIGGNMQGVYIINGPIVRNVAMTEILPDNIEKCVSLCSARKLIFGNWINSKDEYCKPNENHPSWAEYVNDSIIFSLFHSGAGQASCQSSLKIQYESKLFNIKNEFFFMSKEEIMNLANENHFDYTYNDARVSDERYVYMLLKEKKLSHEAQVVLNKAIELTKKSFKYREIFNQEYPEYQIMNWDCGWYQIKALVKEYMKDELEEFTKLYKLLADKMRPMVYELGFLK